MQATKKALIQALESNDLHSIASQAFLSRKVLSILTRIAYDKETLAGWRAIRAIGLCAREIIAKDYEFLRVFIRKQLWSLNDESGGIGWAAPEIVGEIVSADPVRFGDIIPILADVYDVEEVVFRPGILYGLATIAQALPSAVANQTGLAIRALSDSDPLVRVRALELLGFVRSFWTEQDRSVILSEMKRLLADPAEVWVYKNEEFVNIQVKEAAKSII